MSRTRIKVCGVRDAETARAVSDAGADAIGFMFVESSPRFIEPESAWEIVQTLPPLLASVSVVADLDVDGFCALEQRCPTTLAQLHGSEDEDTVARCGPGVVKAIRFDPASIASDLARWDAVDEVDAILVDGSAGGMGESFDWSALGRVASNVRTPIILAGGLTPENVGEAVRAARPWAVDVSSGVERERGVKDAGLIHAFCEAVREADRG